MTTSTITIWHCNASGCHATAPRDTEGWTDKYHTHGCPDHGALIVAHKATVDQLGKAGNGYTSVTTYRLMCACGWAPTPPTEARSSDRMKAQHLAHLAEMAA